MRLTDTERAALVEDFENELSQFLLPMATIAAKQVLSDLLSTRPAAADATATDADTVERVAIAMHQVEGQPRAIPWAKLHKSTQSQYRRMARAALSALPPSPSGEGVESLQSDIATWARETFGSSPQQVRKKLRDEYLELDQYLFDLEEAEGDNSLVDPKQARHDAVKEAADVLFVLFQVAENNGFDLLAETRWKFQVNKTRTWTQQPDGTYQHVKGGSDE